MEKIMMMNHLPPKYVITFWWRWQSSPMQLSFFCNPCGELQTHEWSTKIYIKKEIKIKIKQVEEIFIKKQKPKITKICEQKEKHGTYK